MSKLQFSSPLVLGLHEKMIPVIDLQWFAAEDEGRTEEPSEYKIRKAREEEGRVAKSQELISAVGLLFPGLMLIFLAPSMVRNCTELIRFFFLRATTLDPTKDRMILGTCLLYFIRIVWPIIAVAVVAALFSNIVQVGLLFTTQPLAPKFSRIIPRFGKFFGRAFSVEGLFNFFKSLVKMGIIGVVAYTIIRSNIQKLSSLQTADLWSSVSFIALLAAQLLIISALLLMVLSIPDYMFQRWQYRESLKMSKEEVKEERKMYEGDPQIRARLKARMREILRSNMAINVPKADVVITNPTHFAIALEYDRNQMIAPQVTAKGEDEMAFRIRRLAQDSGVPIVENKPLARALYKEVEVGDFIPEQYWEVVALVLSKVSKINEDRKRARAI
ncbi:flagellar biosynthesis protein FlhB [Spirochaetia bacterium]|nr:flagellar biosynthesis protein FlhB [Spirochaetia bacterium]GHU29281.1 flagellar biosynthesis protein FlhB [Spirochaetia bacterium]